MGTESPDTETMHRLLGDALDDLDLDLTADVVPTVLTGYRHRVKVRRHQAAGTALAALAVLATAGATAGVLPWGGAGRAGSTSAASGPAQGTDSCRHQHWVATPTPDVVVVNELARDPGADQANCEALTAAVRAVFPDARVVPVYQPDLTLDSRLDQTLVKRIVTELRTDPMKGGADQMKYFGSELKYLAIHPDDPANVYQPDAYTVTTPAGREEFGVDLALAKSVPGQPDTFVGSTDSSDCGAVAARLKGTVECARVGTAGGWHGALVTKAGGTGENQSSIAVVNRAQGKSIRLSAGGADDEAWYVKGMYEGIQSEPESVTWVNRWTGQTFAGANPPGSHALSPRQWAEFLDSSAFQKYADSYLAYIKNLS